ncbi:hypothetical protein LTS08_004948 [Lithohypha guttulata]|uniref:Major facilitator superfamily (MFS) profile domain-containing protein n=1 Tax=Lithohypha guttulata TaxID=1690604 RepID=A0AAN7YC12_9EURO|nr:hypothetical protein LTR05_002206 [Lithohypha guttulata]KAK5101341.1 hypothetical protein LTS08_004948 [Lithohypha guttulata]
MPSSIIDTEKEADSRHYEQKSNTNIHAGRDHGLPVEDLFNKADISASAPPPGEKEDKETKRIMRKIDIRLLPVLAIIYSFALIDRVNLPNARIAGMDGDLQLSIGSRYSLVTMMFFVPYIIFQFPANIMIRKLGAGIWLPSLVVAWGALCIGIGFTNRWTELLGCRILLGILEAGYYPGCVFLLSCWYVRYEVQKRFSAFYLLALLASGFSNILAWALSLMDGIGNLAGWRWIFVMEGIITCVLGLMGYVLIVDFPDKSTRIHPITRKAFLTVDEAKIVLGRIERDRGDAVVDKLTFQTIKQHLRDWKIWEYAWLYLLNNTVAYSFGFFLPIILRTEMNYSVTLSQVLSFPPYAAACPWMFATAWVADRYRKRGLILIFNCVAAILGVAMMGFIRSSPGARYTGVFLAVCGANANVPTILSYMHNNIVGQMKRSIASALLIGGGAMGGIAASNIFRQQDAPQYVPALITVICTQALTILHVLKNFWIYSRYNAKADRGELLLEGQSGFRQTL